MNDQRRQLIENFSTLMDYIENLDARVRALEKFKRDYEERSNPQRWYFTFPAGSPLETKYVMLYGSYDYARAEMRERFGTRWANQYSWEEFHHQIGDLTRWEGGD